VSLLFRLAVYVVVLFLVAIVVCGQHHSTAAATLRDAMRRTLRWLWWTFLLLAGMYAFEFVFIGL